MRSGVYLCLRWLLAALYLWVLADRLGLLGGIGNPGVVWGDFKTFLDYTATLNPWAPRGVSDVLGCVVTGLEAVLALWLLSGVRQREAALGSFCLLVTLALSLCLFAGVVEAVDFIAFTVVLAVASWLLYREAARRHKAVRP